LLHSVLLITGETSRSAW